MHQYHISSHTEVWVLQLAQILQYQDCQSERDIFLISQIESPEKLPSDRQRHAKVYDCLLITGQDASFSMTPPVRGRSL